MATTVSGTGSRSASTRSPEPADAGVGPAAPPTPEADVSSDLDPGSRGAGAGATASNSRALPDGDALLRTDPPGGPVEGTTRVRRIVVMLAVGYAVLTTSVLLSGAIVTELVVGSWIGDLDAGLTRWLAGSRWAPLDDVTRVLSNLADTFTVIGTTVGAGVVLLAARLWRQAALLLAGLPLELAVFLSTTYVVARPRPTVVALESLPSTASFPSGHMAASVVLYGGLALIASSLAPGHVQRMWFWSGAALLTVGVGFSRVYRGLHNTIDVLAGASLGIGCLVIAVLIARLVPHEATVTTIERPSTETRKEGR